MSEEEEESDEEVEDEEDVSSDETEYTPEMLEVKKKLIKSKENMRILSYLQLIFVIFFGIFLLCLFIYIVIAFFIFGFGLASGFGLNILLLELALFLTGIIVGIFALGFGFYLSMMVITQRFRTQFLKVLLLCLFILCLFAMCMLLTIGGVSGVIVSIMGFGTSDEAIFYVNFGFIIVLCLCILIFDVPCITVAILQLLLVFNQMEYDNQLDELQDVSSDEGEEGEDINEEEGEDINEQVVYIDENGNEISDDDNE